MSSLVSPDENPTEPESNFARRCAFNYLYKPNGVSELGKVFAASGITTIVAMAPVFGPPGLVLGTGLTLIGMLLGTKKEDPKFEKKLYEQMHDSTFVRVVSFEGKIYRQFRFQSLEGKFELLKTDAHPTEGCRLIRAAILIEKGKTTVFAKPASF